MNKDAITHHPINEYAQKRWSPRVFLDTPVQQEKLVSLFEAARWSASSMNEQPWRFILGIKPDKSWNNIFETLVPGNQVWAHTAPALTIVCGKSFYSHNNSTSTIFQYDVGQAVAHLSIEAMHQGIFVHQMGGFSAEKAIMFFEIPAEFKPLTVIAIGFIGDPDSLTGTLKAREIAPRSRKNLEEIVFREKFGTPGLK